MKAAIETLEIEVSRLKQLNRNYELRQSKEVNQHDEHPFELTEKKIRQHEKAIRKLINVV